MDRNCERWSWDAKVHEEDDKTFCTEDSSNSCKKRNTGVETVVMMIHLIYLKYWLAVIINTIKNHVYIYIDILLVYTNHSSK